MGRDVDQERAAVEIEVSKEGAEEETASDCTEGA
jgi:hypothetical protein